MNVRLAIAPNNGIAIGTAKFFEVNCGQPEHVPDADWMFTTGAYDPVASNRRIQASR